MRKASIKIFLAITMTSIFFTACRKKDAPLPDNLLQFQVANQGISESESEITVNLQLTRSVNQDVPFTISITETGLTYGTDYTINPAPSLNNLALTVLSGSNQASFVIKKTAGALFDGDEQLKFKILTTAAPVIIGTTNELTINFAEIVSTGSSVMGDGGGAEYGNKVFFDLSANRQEAVLRTKWDLGFYSGSDWRVILNSSTGMMAKQINKTDLNAVTAADTVGFSEIVEFSQFAPTTESLNYIDYPDGSLDKTAIDEISATPDNNKVYIVNRGTGVGTPAPSRGWKKIRVIRNASGGYTLQHADIAATSFTNIDIPKNESYFFNYVSFETGAVTVEPTKQQWDLAWTYFSNVTDFGGGEVPYKFQDIILQNRNVSAAKVMVADISYSAFSTADLAGLNFQTTQTAIGADWRSGGGPGSGPAVRTDRFYVIKDGSDNYYKVRFTGLTDGGERGYPSFEYTLVQP